MFSLVFIVGWLLALFLLVLRLLLKVLDSEKPSPT